MAAITSTYTDPSDTFVWWIEGDKIAIATIEGEGGTSETGRGNLKAVQLGTGNTITDGFLISYYAEPDEYTDMSQEIDIDNTLHPAIIAFVKGKALMDKAASTNNPQLAQIKSAAAANCMREYDKLVRRYGAKRRDKTGGTRAVVPADLR
tara:strand:- start:1116 stop:1565 length:450 start_codon:yes stop_codon:yes gene_type:complete